MLAAENFFPKIATKSLAIFGIKRTYRHQQSQSSPTKPATYNSNSEEYRPEDPDLLVEPPLQVLVRARQPELVEHRQVHVGHDESHQNDAKTDAQVARAVDIDLGWRAQERYAGYEAGYEAHADGEGLHVAAADEVLVLAVRPPDEAEVDADAAAGQQHRDEDRVVGEAEVLQRVDDVLDARLVVEAGGREQARWGARRRGHLLLARPNSPDAGSVDGAWSSFGKRASWFGNFFFFYQRCMLI